MATRLGDRRVQAQIPEAVSWSEAFARWDKVRADARPGQCWLRTCDCPFSRERLQRLPGLDAPIIEQVSAIHRECLQRETHLRPI